MKLDLHIYVAQPKRGLYEASIPWVPELAEPVRGPSAAQLKEELMFRALELVHGGLDAADFDRLLPPQRPYVTSIYLDIERRVDPERPPVHLTTTTHVIVGGWPGDDITRFWLPKLPGTCLCAERVDDMYAVLNVWLSQWAEANQADDLRNLDAQYVGGIETMAIDLGFPPALPSDEDPQVRSGRMHRPEILQQVATNLSHRAEDHGLTRAFGRGRLVDDLVEAITSPRPANLVLVGPSGVGKTALIHEAASRAWELSQAYQQRRDVWQTSGDRIIAGMSIVGQWEQRAEAICRELTERGDLLFAEDLLGLIRAGRTYQGDSNLARFIEPYLEQDAFAIIAEATDDTYALARAMAPGFVDKFRRVQVPELSYKETLAVVNEFVREIEGLHPIRFSADGVESILQLTGRFFRQEAFPGKAVRLVKQCHYEGLRVQHEELMAHGEVRIGAEEVARVVQRQTGLPTTILRPGAGRTPQAIRQAFEARVFDQPEAMEALSSLVVAIEQGLTDPSKPLGSFLLIGPSGVGKTETAKALAADLFGSEERMVRFDMSEFHEAYAATRLIGTPRDPDGELTGKVRMQPFCVLLFDEIEKAHPSVLDLLLQVLGDGRLSDAAGRTVDFRNAIVIMTSNLGAGSEDRWMGFADASERDRLLHYRRAAEDFFRPELFNRIDTIVAYRSLGPSALRRIARRTLQNLLERRGLRQAQVMVDVDEGLIDYLALGSVDNRYGARTLTHRIERQLIAPLAHRLTRYQGGGALTRVSIRPAADGEGVDLDMETIERAPRVQPTPLWKARDMGEAADPAELLAHMTEVYARVRHLAEDPRVEQVSSQYDALLGELNRAAGAGEAWPSDLAQRLRQREGFIGRVHDLERRIGGLMDPRGTGEFLLSANPEERKTQLHRWRTIAAELEREIVWLRCQLDALIPRADARADGAPEPGGTLLLTGLSGPYHELVGRWHRWLQALSAAFDLDLVFAFRVGDTWLGDNTEPEDLQRIDAFAAASETPGALAIFHALTGFVFNPRPPSHGQHALVVSRVVEGATNDAALLLEQARSGLASAEQPRPFIEFVEKDGKLEDVRLAHERAIPDDRASNLQDFVTELITDRLAAMRARAVPVAEPVS